MDTYGYGPTDRNFPSIVGFFTSEEAIAKAESWLQKGMVWDSKRREYVADTAETRAVKIYRDMQELGTITAERQSDGSYLTTRYVF